MTLPEPPEWSRVVAHEATLDDSARTAGAHYTPWACAVGLAERSLGLWTGSGVPDVVDPSCGAGSFLLAVAEVLRHRGADPELVLSRLHGVDLDAGAIQATRDALRAWGTRHGLGPDTRAALIVGDALDPALTARIRPEAGFDLVIGNPPFQNQLAAATSRSGDDRLAAAQRFGTAGKGYVDTAALFLLLSMDLVGSDGVVTMIQPRSFLSASAAGDVRDRVRAGGAVAGIWLPAERVFEAAVDVCGVTVLATASSRDAEVGVWCGPDASTDLGRVTADVLNSRSWGGVVAMARGVPGVPARPEPSLLLGDGAEVVAGFRDEYYAVVDALVDAAPTARTDSDRFRPVATVGLIEPGRIDWGEREARIARRRWSRPMVDVEQLGRSHPAARRWVDDLATPKVLVATQTRVIEAAADRTGLLVPLTPVLAVRSVRWGLNDLMAALLAPPASAWAHWRCGGSGMSATAIRVSASDLRELPIPVDVERWDDAATQLAGGASWDIFGRTACASWGLDDTTTDAVMAWWLPNVRLRDRVADDLADEPTGP